MDDRESQGERRRRRRRNPEDIPKRPGGGGLGQGWGHDGVESARRVGPGEGRGVGPGRMWGREREKGQGKEVGPAQGRPGAGCRLRDLEPGKLQRAEEQRVA